MVSLQVMHQNIRCQTIVCTCVGFGHLKCVSAHVKASDHFGVRNVSGDFETTECIGLLCIQQIRCYQCAEILCWTSCNHREKQYEGLQGWQRSQFYLRMIKLRNSQLLKPSMNFYMYNRLFAQNPFLATFAFRKNSMRDCRVGNIYLGPSRTWCRLCTSP